MDQVADMLTRVKIHVVDWEDPRFVVALQAAWKCLLVEGVELDSPTAAVHAEELLRASGFPTAEIRYDRTVSDIQVGTATWTVRRDGVERAHHAVAAASGQHAQHVATGL